ncbi:unnamed protein product [Ectocarpus sp. 13 AM-2016]
MHLYPTRAVLEGAEVEIFTLLSYGATPEQWREWLRAPLEHAAARGEFRLVEKLLNAGADGGAGWSGCRGRTLLDAAALGGNPDVVTALLRAGCLPDVNVVSVSSRRSALHLSAVCGHEAAARKLILAGADANRVDPAEKCGPLHVAAAGGHCSLVSDLLIGGAYPNARDLLGRTPLHRAAYMGQDVVVAVLTDMPSTGKDILDYRELSPLMVASQRGHLSTVKTLLNAGADVTIRPSHGNSALHLAARQGRVEVITAILEHGADVNDSDSTGLTALHAGCMSNQAGAVSVLLDAGADIDGKNGAFTPLILAITLGAGVQVVHNLLRRGCQVSAPLDKTALHWACMLMAPGFDAIVDLLLRWGLSELTLDNDGRTPAARLSVAEGSFSRMAREVERAHALLVNAPADRAWRRRSWLVMLRARTERERVMHSANNGGSSSREREAAGQMMVRNKDRGGGNKVPRIANGGGGGAGSGGKNNELQVVGGWAAEGDFGGLVAKLFNVLTESEGVFCTVLGYL